MLVEQADGRFEHGRDVGVGLAPRRRGAGEADPQPPPRRPGDQPDRRVDRIARRSLHCREPRRGVADGAAEARLDGKVGHRAPGVADHPRAARLQPDQAAARRRDPDRAAAVVAVRDRDDARRDRRRRSAARPAGRVAERPRVARRPRQQAFGRRQQAELGQVRPPDRQQPGARDGRGGGAIGNADPVPQRAAATGPRQAALLDIILDQRRDARHRPARSRHRRGGSAGAVVVRVGDGIDQAVDAVEPGDRRLDQRRGRRPFAVERRRGTDRVARRAALALDPGQRGDRREHRRAFEESPSRQHSCLPCTPTL